MTFAVPGALTGSAQTGFTTPGYTCTVDQAPDTNGKQVAVTALTGTQAGVSTHTPSNPFTMTWWKYKVAKILGLPNPTTGKVTVVPFNVQKFVTRKGMLPLAGQAPAVAVMTTVMEVPAGADSASPSEIRAMVSAHVGALSNQSAGVGDTLVTGIVG